MCIFLCFYLYVPARYRFVRLVNIATPNIARPPKQQSINVRPIPVVIQYEFHLALLTLSSSSFTCMAIWEGAINGLIVGLLLISGTKESVGEADPEGIVADGVCELLGEEVTEGTVHPSMA